MLIATMKFNREQAASVKVYKLSCRVWPDFQHEDAQVRLGVVIGNESNSSMPISGLSAFFPYEIEDGSIHYINRAMLVLLRTDPKTSAPTKLIELNGKQFFSTLDGIPQVAAANVTCRTTHLERNCTRMDIHFESSLPPGEKVVFYIAFRAKGVFTFDKLLTRFNFSMMRISDLGYEVGTAQLSEALEIPWLKAFFDSDRSYFPGGIDFLLHYPMTSILGNLSLTYIPCRENQSDWLGEESNTKYQVVNWSAWKIMGGLPDLLSIYSGENGVKITGTLAKTDMMLSNYRRGELLAIIGIVLGIISLVTSLLPLWK